MRASAKRPPVNPMIRMRPSNAMHFVRTVVGVAADRVVDHVGAAAVGCFLHRVDEVVLAVVDRELGAELAAHLDLFGPPAVAMTRAPAASPSWIAALPTPPAPA